MANRPTRSHKQAVSLRLEPAEKLFLLRSAAFSDVLDEAKRAHSNGDLTHAKRLYSQVLAVHPHNDSALHLLGFAEYQSGNFTRAIELLDAAVAICPSVGEYHVNLALAYLANQQLELARQHSEEASHLGHRDASGYWHLAVNYYRRREFEWAELVIQLGLIVKPDSVELQNIFGVVYAEQQQYLKAEACYRVAVELQPQFVEAWNNLGNVLRQQKRIDESIPCFVRAIQLAPHFATAHNNLGVALANSGRPEEAIRCYERALRITPQCPEAINNLGNAYRDLGNRESAIACYQKALVLRPDSADILTNLGIALQQVEALPLAINCFRRALLLEPNSSEIHGHLGSAFQKVDQFTEAVACFQHAAHLAPEQPLFQLQAATVCPTVFLSRTEMSDYQALFLERIASVRLHDFPLELATFTNVAPASPFNLQFFDGCIRRFKQEYAAVFASKLASAYRSSWLEAWRGPNSRPRIGIVATEDHEGIFVKSLQGVIQRISHAKFHIVVFCSHRGIRRVQAALQQDDLTIVALPARFEKTLQTIDDARCDLLYYWEVGTDRFSYFLPFARLAPIQMTSWGIQVTSGIPNLDYYLSSELVEPPNAANHYSESLVLAKTLLTYRKRTEHEGNLLSRDAFPIPAAFHWYVCAQQAGKFHLDFDGTIAAILRQDEKGAFILTVDKDGPIGRRLKERFQNEMPDVADRIFFLPRLDRARYLSLLQNADVLLDAPHFSGVNSTYDGLSFGKPIVALPSEFHRGRYTLGCYRKMHVDDCIARNAEDYVRISVDLATNADRRRDVERRILEASGVLFEDDTAVAEHDRMFDELLAAGKLK